MLLQTLTVREHLLTDITLFWLSPCGDGGIFTEFIQVNNCMVFQLAHLVETLTTNITFELFKILVSLVVGLQHLGEHGPVVATDPTEQHVTVPAVLLPEVGGKVPPLIGPALAPRFGTLEATGLLVAAQVVAQVLLLLEHIVAALEGAMEAPQMMIYFKFQGLELSQRFCLYRILDSFLLLLHFQDGDHRTPVVLLLVLLCTVKQAFLHDDAEVTLSQHVVRQDVIRLHLVVHNDPDTVDALLWVDILLVLADRIRPVTDQHHGFLDHRR